MKINYWPATGELDLTATAAELTRLADMIAVGTGSLTCTPETLVGVKVADSADPGVRIHLDGRREVLLITGGPAARNILAHNIRGVAEMDDGGHLHVDYFPDHPYLLADSLPLVVKSPHGGMPARKS
ncbi:hypothetical protein GCM10027176_18240 [Actinoallomurus bryophytorum]|uniref:Uncharacterized protein n=1 Tax=Actinoallomurus bryophytorum TaxID=1490222 RepID=A0A543CLC2_9ACTN|nr:hypothetical protein [Actinoallomurus bryophytorum]TQL97889.1 hypothetical protein FB559_3499 [Actinoallomurus bryophytorum]